jgi:hypothetical protein
MLYQHPEQLRAVAPVTSNYLGRWMTPESFSRSPARANLPVRVFQSGAVPSPFIAQQTANAIELAKAHGYGQVSLVAVNKPHGPLAEEVMSYFFSILKQ